MNIIGKLRNKPISDKVAGEQRIQSFDIARTFAILCVVLCHSVETAYANIKYASLSSFSQIFRIVFFSIGRLGVPIFLFLTGALVLKKQIETDEDIIKFYKKNLLPLLITVEIWNIIYNLFNWIRGEEFSFEVLFKNILFFEQVDMNNMWYMLMILGIYVAIPFISIIVKKVSFKTIIIPMFLVFVASSLLPSINVILEMFNIEQYKIVLDLNFLGGVYGLYILCGYYINNNSLKKYNNIFLISMFLLFFSITCIIQYWSYLKDINYNVWYDFVTLFVCSIFLFEIFNRVKNVKKNIFISVTEYLSKISLAIFFVHKIVLSFLIEGLSRFNLINPVECIILFIASFVLSVLIIYIISKDRLLKEKIFLIKG